MKATLLVMFALLVSNGAAAPTVVSVPCIRDNTIYAPNSETNSNGGGGTFGAGNNGLNEPRRGLLLFDLSAIPTGAVIEDATLTLTLARAPNGDPDRLISLHRLLASWGENPASDAGTGMGAGFGVPAELGDATWIMRFFDQALQWATPGGDFVAAASAITVVPSVTMPPPPPFTWSGSGLLNDVRAWLSAPASNFGWIVRGDETIDRSNRQFHTRETTTPGTAPTLQVTFSLPGVESIEREPDGGYRVRGIGHPGQTYEIQFTPELATASWQFLALRTADPQGRYSLVDLPPGDTPRRFYRAVPFP